MSDEESLRAAERRLQAAQLASDVDALAELIDDAARFTGPDGTLATKADDLAVHASGRQVLNRLDEEQLDVLANDHVGVTWFLGTLQVTVDGQPITARMRYTRTWVHDPESGWRVIAAHATFVQ
jgi:ketosteroid isomerase-like protein